MAATFTWTPIELGNEAKRKLSNNAESQEQNEVTSEYVDNQDSQNSKRAPDSSIEAIKPQKKKSKSTTNPEQLQKDAETLTSTKIYAREYREFREVLDHLKNVASSDIKSHLADLMLRAEQSQAEMMLMVPVQLQRRVDMTRAIINEAKNVL